MRAVRARPIAGLAALVGMAGALAGGVAGGMVGCGGPAADRGLDARDPAPRIGAVVEAASASDAGVEPRLVELLDSDDPAVRMLSIRALERRTGRTLGYDHAAQPADRAEAIQAWRVFLAARGEPGGPATGPEPAAASGQAPTR